MVNVASVLLLLNILQILGQKDIVIETQLGKIRGLVHSTGTQQTVYSFYGIKYGISPIDNLRFRPAQLNTTKWNGIYDGTKYGDMCWQPYITGGMSEDCLFLNVWTPKPNRTGSLLPVMLFIHGGGFVTGSGAYYPGRAIVEEGNDFVYVSINYRLGSFGFLQNAEIYKEDLNWKSYGGMNGVYDQIQSLHYVKQYISDYGGDPNDITIFGESAGGLSVCYLLISPLATGLFDRAILESGACNGPWGGPNTTYCLQIYDELLTDAGYPTDNMQYLRSIPAQQFLNKMGYPPLTWEACVDGLIITDLARNIFADLKKSGNVFNANKFIIGFNTLDALNMGSPQPQTQSEYEKYINYYVKNSTAANLLYSYYYPSSDFPAWTMEGKYNYNSYQLGWFSINTDVGLTCPSLKIAQQIDDELTNDIMYVYQFGGPSGDNGIFYAPHSSELPFVFDTKKSELVPWNQTLSNQIVSAWTNFGKYGIPNITDSINKINVDWSYFGGNSVNDVMIFEDTAKIKSSFKQNYRKNVCDFWYNEIGIDIMTQICLDTVNIKLKK